MTHHVMNPFYIPQGRRALLRSLLLTTGVEDTA